MAFATIDRGNLEERIVQEQLKGAIDHLSYLFTEHLLNRASEVNEAAFGSNDPNRDGASRLAENIAVSPEHYHKDREILEERANEIIEGYVKGDKDKIRLGFQDLNQGQFRNSQTMKKITKRPLSINTHIAKYADASNLRNLIIDDIYNENAILAYTGKFDILKNNEILNKETRGELYKEALGTVHSEFLKRYKENVSEKLTFLFYNLYSNRTRIETESQHSGRNTEQRAIKKFKDSMDWYNAKKTEANQGKETEITAEMKADSREIYKHDFGKEATTNREAVIYTKYKHLTLDAEIENFVNECTEKGKEIIRNSEPVQALNHRLTRNGNKTLPGSIVDALARFYGQEEKAMIKFGIDPTGSEIHLGHAVPMLQLKYMQEQGYKPTIVVGDWTAQIGDPTGRTKERSALDVDDVKKFASQYFEQVSSILDPENINVLYNGRWFEAMGAKDLMYLLSDTSVKELLNRPEFHKRIQPDTQSPLTVPELIYIIFQGYDSVFTASDFEFGAKDQLVNMKKGRELQKKYGMRLQNLVMTPQLTGPQGVEKMSKTGGNAIPIRSSPKEMYGKLMAITDSAIEQYYQLLTDVPDEFLTNLRESLGLGKYLTKIERTINKLKEKEDKDYSKIYTSDEIRNILVEEKVNGERMIAPILKTIDDWLLKYDSNPEYEIEIRTGNKGYKAEIIPRNTETTSILETIAKKENMDPDAGKPVDNTSIYHPMEAKKGLAYTITKFFHGEEKAKDAQENWNRVFSMKKLPKTVELYQPSNIDDLMTSETPLVDLIYAHANRGVDLTTEDPHLSKSEIRRRIKQNGVNIKPTEGNWYKASSFDEPLPDGEFIIRYGKKDTPFKISGSR